jgi:hypothetical protein
MITSIQGNTPSTPAEIPTATITWQTLRSSIETVRAHGRAYLVGQVWLGWQINHLKEEHRKAGGGHGGDRRSSRQSGDLKSWAEIVKQETGLPDRTADRLTELYHAALAKLKRVQTPLTAKATLLAFREENPLSIVADEASELREVILSLVEGETQKSLLSELGVIPKAKPMPKATQAKASTDPGQTAGQLAFHFFDAVAAPLINARTNPDYQKLLYSLPFESDEENPLSLATLEAEFRAALADIEAVKAAAHKAARAKIINI